MYKIALMKWTWIKNLNKFPVPFRNVTGLTIVYNLANRKPYILQHYRKSSNSSVMFEVLWSVL